MVLLDCFKIRHFSLVDVSYFLLEGVHVVSLHSFPFVEVSESVDSVFISLSVLDFRAHCSQMLSA